KHGDTFAVFDHFGDVKPTGLGEEGLYHEGTRFLSCLVLALNGGRPLFLSSTVGEDTDVLTVDLTNPDLYDGERLLTRGELHLAPSKFLWQGACYERLRVKNYGRQPARAAITYHFEADFADIFEVRGTRRERRGRQLPGEAGGGAVTLAYEGLDQVLR